MDQSPKAKAMRFESDIPKTPAEDRGHVAHLSRDRIIRGAIDLLDAEGLTGLSMRRLADNLDAGAMSLYWYFSTKNELLKATTDTVLGEIQLEHLAADWQAAIREMAIDLRAVIHRHPWLRQMLSSSPAVGANGLAVIEAILLILARTGLTKRQLDIAATTIFGYVLGFAVGENVWVRTFQEVDRGALVLPAEVAAEHQFMAAFIADAAGFDPDQRFTTGVNLILAGIASGVLAEPDGVGERDLD